MDLRELLKKSADRFSLFADSDFISQFNLNSSELIEIIKESLTNDEKVRLFDLPYFQQLNADDKAKIISSITESKDRLTILRKEKIVDNLGDYLTSIIIALDDREKVELLQDKEFWKNHSIEDLNIKGIFGSLEEKSKEQILKNPDILTNTLGVDILDIASLINTLKNEDSRESLLNVYDFSRWEKIEIIKNFSSEKKRNILLSNNELKKDEVISILQSFDFQGLSEFYEQNKDLFAQKQIEFFEVTKGMPEDQQKRILENIMSLNLDLEDKKKILATIDPKVKMTVNIGQIPQELQGSFKIKYDKEEDKIGVDFNSDFNVEDYKGLDDYISINPERFNEEQRERLKKLCLICPNMEVLNLLDSYKSFTSKGIEYLQGEKWIEEVLKKIKPEYTDAQKIAIIDNAIGRKISYSPDYETEIFNYEDCRSIWRIISTGYGVCNGISKTEQYILSRVGIKSKLVSSSNHSFLKLENMEFQLANGEIVNGTTILDPTWNLSNHRLGSKPKNFFISYEDIRKHDINRAGDDSMCHKNDEKLKDATFTLDDDSLRMLFSSVGLADRDGIFPIASFMEESKEIDENYANNLELNIEKQLELIAKSLPEFAKTQNTTMKIMSYVFSKRPHLNLRKCVVNRVYNREDSKKEPVVYLYVESESIGKKFFVASNEENQFVKLSRRGV